MKHLSFEEEMSQHNEALKRDYRISRNLWTAFIIMLSIAFLVSAFGLYYVIKTSPHGLR